MTASQDVAPHRQGAPQGTSGATKAVVCVVAVVATIGCLWLIVGAIARDGHAGTFAVATVLSVGLAAGASFATWLYGVRRTREAVDAATGAQAETARLLRLALDGHPDPVLLVDGDDHCLIANQALARRAGAQPDDLVGVPTANFLSPDEQSRQEDLNRRARELARAQSRTHRSDPSQEYRVTRTDHVPILDGPGVSDGVLIVERDLTGIAAAHETDSRMMTRLIRTLVKLLDGRDPYAAHHSAKVAIVAHAIAEELGLSDDLTATAKLAGSLLNIGKILAPTELLTRDGALTEEERQRVRDGLQASADLVSHIEFPGPVVDTLRQVFENWDGSGVPRGLKGDEILITAQAVSLANSFVAMISPRAYRAGVGIDEAITALKREAGSTYGPDVVAALASRLRERKSLENLE